MTQTRANIVFAEKDRALREDVHRLGELVGELVYEQAGEALFDLVEAARRAAISRREGDASSYESLRDIIEALAPSSARDFIRAFSTYFQMVNMAEKVHRIRRRREYLNDPGKRQPFGFRDIFERLHAHGCSLNRLEQLLGALCIEPVFAAHSLEVTRRTLLRKQQSIAKRLIAMLDPYLTPMEVEATLGQIRLDMTTGWQTAEQPSDRRISDDAEHVLFFITDVLYRMIPPFYENLEQALNATYGADDHRIRVPEVVRFSSWVGGDMDGNPTVTGKSIRQMLARQRALVLDLYYHECHALSGHLSQTEGRCSFSPELLERIEVYRGHFAKAAYSLPLRHSRMPYRMLLRLMQARLQATYDDAAFPYESPEEFIADIELIANSLRANLGRNAGLFAVKRLLRRAETFRFHLATLDLRQNALVHRRVIGEALQEAQWLELAPKARVERIKEAIERRVSPASSLGSEARRTLAVFQTIAHSRRRYGQRSIGIYIVRSVHGADDVLSVLLLAKWGHLGPKDANAPLDVAPLFETTDELANAADIMESLLADELYRAHLRERGDRQFVMLAYAASNRQGDILSARWILDKTHRALAAVLQRHGVELVVFHGRGGPLSRTGGPVHEALGALPRAAVAQHLRMTEQGEAINTRYGLRGIALRSLEQLVSAVLWNEAGPAAEPEPLLWREAMADIAEASGAMYADLVFDEGFAAYFRDATPIDVIERIEEEAIVRSPTMSPVEGVDEGAWVLAWAQNRCLVYGWLGFGTAIQAAIARHGLEQMQDMAARWPLLRIVVADVEFALAKSDLNVTEQYSQLAGAAHEQYFPRLREEYDRSIEAVLALTKQSKLLERSETMARSIELRNPYVDPMSFLQVSLLRRWRAGGRARDALFQALLNSVHGIAHAMQDSG